MISHNCGVVLPSHACSGPDLPLSLVLPLPPQEGREARALAQRYKAELEAKEAERMAAVASLQRSRVLNQALQAQVRGVGVG